MARSRIDLRLGAGMHEPHSREQAERRTTTGRPDLVLGQAPGGSMQLTRFDAGSIDHPSDRVGQRGAGDLQRFVEQRRPRTPQILDQRLDRIRLAGNGSNRILNVEPSECY